MNKFWYDRCLKQNSGYFLKSSDLTTFSNLYNFEYKVFPILLFSFNFFFTWGCILCSSGKHEYFV